MPSVKALRVKCQSSTPIFASLPERINIKYLIYLNWEIVGIEPTTYRVYIRTVVPYATSEPYSILTIEKYKKTKKKKRPNPCHLETLQISRKQSNKTISKCILDNKKR